MAEITVYASKIQIMEKPESKLPKKCTIPADRYIHAHIH